MGCSMVEFIGDIFAEALDTDFTGKSILILGYQKIIHSKPLLYSYAKRMGVCLDYTMLKNNRIQGGGDIKSLMYALGFSKVNVLDVSNYEGADIVFDLNSEIVPDNLKESFDYIVESGTLEHIFNFPQALANITSMLKQGGKVFHYLPAHNFINHGYYTVSPAVLQDFYERNGFQIKKLDILLIKWDENLKQGEYFQPKNLDYAFATVPDYRVFKVISGNFDKLNGYRGLVRCIAVKRAKNNATEKPGQSQWFKYAELENIQLTLRCDLMLDDTTKKIGVIGKTAETKLLLKVILSINENCVKTIKVLDNIDNTDNIFCKFESFSDEQMKDMDILVIGDTSNDKQIYSQIRHLEKNGATIVHWNEWKPLFWMPWANMD